MSRRKIKVKTEKKKEVFSEEDLKIMNMVSAGKDIQEIMKDLNLDTFQAIDRVVKLVGKITGNSNHS
jgi:N-acetylmuramic acid 6-phosphate (MurNAc-6-P) etherase